MRRHDLPIKFPEYNAVNISAFRKWLIDYKDSLENKTVESNSKVTLFEGESPPSDIKSEVKNKLVLPVISGIINYLDEYATLDHIRKRTRGASPPRVKDINELIDIVLDSSTSNHEKHTKINRLFVAQEVGFSGSSQLKEMVNKEIDQEDPSIRAQFKI